MSGSGNVLSVVTCFGSEVGTMAASRIGSGCRSSYVPLVTFMESQQCRSVCQYSLSFGHCFLASSMVKQGFAIAAVTVIRGSNKLATIAAAADW
jgi:hypothetical protein